MRVRQFTPRQTQADVRITTLEYKPVSDVGLKLDDLYARAWVCDYEQRIFDVENDNAMPLNSTGIPVQSNISTEEMRSTPGTAHECSPEMFPKTEKLSDVTNTYSDMEPDVEITSEQPNNSPTSRRSSKYIFYQKSKPKCNDDYRYLLVSWIIVFHGTRTQTFQKFKERVT